MTKKLTQEALDACELTGINPADLIEKYTYSSSNITLTCRPLDQFKASAETEEIAKLRYDYYEKRRKDKLSIVLSQANELLYKQHLLITQTTGWNPPPPPQ